MHYGRYFLSCLFNWHHNFSPIFVFPHVWMNLCEGMISRIDLFFLVNAIWCTLKCMLVFDAWYLVSHLLQYKLELKPTFIFLWYVTITMAKIAVFLYSPLQVTILRTIYITQYIKKLLRKTAKFNILTKS